MPASTATPSFLLDGLPTPQGHVEVRARVDGHVLLSAARTVDMDRPTTWALAGLLLEALGVPLHDLLAAAEEAPPLGV